MTLNPKKIGLYSVIGVLAAVMIIAAVFATGIPLPSTTLIGDNSPNGTPSNSNNPAGTNNPAGNNPTNPLLSNTGTLMVSIKDKPANLAELYITISGMYAQNADTDSWIELALTEEGQESFDLLALVDTSILLSEQGIPAGSYTKIRLEVSQATAYYAEEPTVPVELRVPPGHIDVLIHFEITADTETHVMIDMQPDTVAISQSGNLKPVIKATIIPADQTTSSTSTDNTPSTNDQTETTPTPTATPTTSPTPDNTPEPTPTPTPDTSPTSTPTPPADPATSPTPTQTTHS